MIKLNVLGIITQGPYKDWEVVIQEVNESFIVAYWSKEKHLGFDDWYENRQELELKMPFTINWTDKIYQSNNLTKNKRKNIENFIALANKKGFKM